MKRHAMILVLFALIAVPAFAAPAPEAAPSPAPAWLSAPAQSCPAPAPTVLPNGLFPEPIFWSEDLGPVEAAGCASYCRTCDGCCAILGPNTCACC